jgi:phage shock protein A
VEALKMTKDEKVGTRLKSIDEKIAQLKARKHAMKTREKNKERAERTRRLIQNGALAEQYLQCKDMETEQFEVFLSILVSAENFADLIFQAQQDSALSLKQTRYIEDNHETGEKTQDQQDTD